MIEQRGYQPQAAAKPPASHTPPTGGPRATSHEAAAPPRVSTTPIPDPTLRRWLKRILDMDTVLRLYVNKDRPGRQDMVDDFTELSGHSYQPIILMPHVWTFDEARAEASAPLQTWVLQSGLESVDVYGYYITERSDDSLCWAAHFPTPYTVEVDYDQVKVRPRVALK